MRVALASLVAVLAGCSQSTDAPAPKPLACANGSGARFSDVDCTVDPCADLYAFACNRWLASTKLDDGEDMRDRSFGEVNRAVEDLTHDVLERARSAPGDDPLLQRLGTYYASCMDEDAIERAGVGALGPLLHTISLIHDARSLSEAAAALSNARSSNLFSWAGVLSPSDTRRVMIWGLRAARLGLDHENYAGKDANARDKRATYERGVASVLRELGRDVATAAGEAHAIVALEAEQADPENAPDFDVASALQHEHDDSDGRSGMSAWLPHFAWEPFLAGVGVTDPHTVRLMSPETMSVLDHQLVATPWNVWRAYLSYRLIDAYRVALPRRFRDPTDKTPRWRVCANSTWSWLFDVIGQVYVREAFDAAHETQARALIAPMEQGMRDALAHATWLDPVTRMNAELKLGAIRWQIGHPTHWSRQDVPLKRDAFAANLLALMQLEVTRERTLVGTAIDADVWEYTVSAANAVYVQPRNIIEVPAGILQAPFFDAKGPAAVNLGAMGMVVGHELTHAFDSQGADFDEYGARRDWWQSEAHADFKHRVSCVIEQYNGYKTSVGNVDGSLTARENIADIGGLKLAFAAYRAARDTSPNPDALAGDQEFFLSFARTLCRKARPSWERWALTHDVHAPSSTRVNGAVSALAEFAEAFHCKAGAPLAPAKRCAVW